MLSKKEKRVKEVILNNHPGRVFHMCRTTSDIKLEFNDNFVKYSGKSVEIQGVLSKITAPYEKIITMSYCPQCLEEGTAKFYFEEEHPDQSRWICGKCYDSYGACYDIEEESIPISLQVLTFEHPVFSKKVMVGYVYSEEYPPGDGELTKKDIGKTYAIHGILNNYHEVGAVIHSGDLELITPDDEDTVELVGESRDIPGYDEWRKNVLSRDKHCVVCGGDKHLHVHHLYGYKEYPDLRVDVSNGVTVCKFCHERYHSYYGLSDITPDKFIQFMRRFVVR